MLMITIIPFIVLIAGGLMWALCKTPKLQDAGRGLFFIGAFVLTWHYANAMVRIGQSAAESRVLA